MITVFGLEKSRFTYLLMVLVLFMGIMSYFDIPKRENPAITIRTAAVAAYFEGMAPERIEELVAIPIERKMREIGEIEDIRTTVTNGSVLLYADLYDEVPSADIENAWEDLRNKMGDVAAELPDGTQGPFVNTDYGDVAIATVGITGDGFSLAQLEDIAEELRRELYLLDGISKVTLHGVQDERIWLDLDTRRLASVRGQIGQLLEDLAAQNVILPAGEIDANGTRVVLEANGDLDSVEEISEVLTKVDGLDGFIRLSDLVEVRRGYIDPKDDPVFINGEPAVILAAEMAETADIQVLGRALRVALDNFEQRQPIGVELHISAFQETNVTAAINSALSNVGQTFIVVFIVMLLFLGLRAAFVISCIVPFTVMFALSNMGIVGVDIEQVSIAAVIISLGLLVDNGLVVVEDIQGRIKDGVDPAEAAKQAGSQYMIPLGVASITTISAFVPMLMMTGSSGEFAFSLGAVVSLMLLGSWLTALYVLPFLSARLFKQPKQEEKESANKLVWYGSLTRKLLPYGIPLTVLVYLLVAGAMTQFSNVKPEMFPLSDRGDFIIYMDMPEDTAISETERYALEVEAWLSDKSINPDVVNTATYVGYGGPRFYLALSPADANPSSAFFAVNMTDVDAVREIVPRVRRAFIEQFPAARFRVTRLSMGGSESGIVQVQITGPDAAVLMDAADKVERAYAGVPGISRNEIDWGKRVLKIVLDIAQDKARESGITSEDLSQVMEAYFSGSAYSVFREADQQIPIVLRAETRDRDSIEDLANMSVNVGDRLISVDQVASFQPRLEYSEIRRENQVRQITIYGKSENFSAQGLLAEIQPVLDGLDLGPEYAITIGGELEDSGDTYGEIGGNLPIALGIMLAALVFQFNSMRRTLATFMTIPVIMIGAPFALIITGQPMSFFAVLGLMSLMGIIINNAIVLINQIDLDAETMSIEDAIVSAAQKRATPIMLTSLTTVFGLVPLALAGGSLFEPMATIMIGGLLVASPLTLLFVPSLCYTLMKREQRRAAAS